MKQLASLIKPLIIILIFFIAYAALGIIRHNHYGSFGADLGFIDELFWRYSHFDFSKLIGGSHLEFTSLLFIPVYWVWTDPRMLIVLQAFIITFSGLAVFLLAKRRKLQPFLCYAILFSYMAFFGIQNAIWFDVHSSVWGAAFFTWFIYFLDNGNKKASILMFLLAIGSKENVAGFTFLFCAVYFIVSRKREALYFTIGSLAYLYLLFGLIFPATLPKGYSYASHQGLISGSPLQLFDTAKKQETIFYTFAWFGFIPIVLPLFVIPILGNLASYFIIGREYIAAHEIFMHYRVDLAPLLVSATIFAIARYKWLNNKYIAIYLLICLILFQYTLHLPISYLAKKWFWTTPSGVPSINKMLTQIPASASLAAQNNIYPHVSQRNDISLIWPDERTFKDNSPCGKSHCPWLRWTNNPEYMIVDLSPEWDIRHLLQQNEDYKIAVAGLEKEGVIKKYKQDGTTIIFKVLRKP